MNNYSTDTIKAHVPVLLLLLVFILPFMGGCSHDSLPEAWSTKEVTFQFEAGPGSISWWTPDNTSESRMLTDDEAASGFVTLTVLKGSVTPVLFYRTGTLEPEGCIWPVSSEMDGAGGFCSRMLWRLLTETDPESGPPEAVRAFCARFNWKRFYEKTASVEDPWSLDQTAILRAIAGGTFTLRDLR